MLSAWCFYSRHTAGRCLCQMNESGGTNHPGQLCVVSSSLKSGWLGRRRLLDVAGCVHSSISLQAAAWLVFKGFLGMFLTEGQGGAGAGTRNTDLGGQTGCLVLISGGLLAGLGGIVLGDTAEACSSSSLCPMSCFFLFLTPSSDSMHPTPPGMSGLHWNMSWCATGRRSGFRGRGQAGQEPPTALEEKTYE